MGSRLLKWANSLLYSNKESYTKAEVLALLYKAHTDGYKAKEAEIAYWNKH